MNHQTEPEQPLPTPTTLAAALALWQHSGQRHDFPVQGSSMEPLLRPGDVVEVVHRPGPLHCGDVIVFKQGDSVVVHRLLRQNRKRGRFLARGDNRLDADPPVTAADVVGRVVAVRRGSRTVRLDTAFWRAAGRLIAWGGLGWLALYRPARTLKRQWLGTRRLIVWLLLQKFLLKSSALALQIIIYVDKVLTKITILR